MLTCPDWLHHMGKKSFLWGWRWSLATTPYTQKNKHLSFVKTKSSLLQNPSEASDEELNDDLLQSDDEEINAR